MHRRNTVIMQRVEHDCAIRSYWLDFVQIRSKNCSAYGVLESISAGYYVNRWEEPMKPTYLHGWCYGSYRNVRVNLLHRQHSTMRLN
jgi:hypothetical protein